MPATFEDGLVQHPEVETQAQAEALLATSNNYKGVIIGVTADPTYGAMLIRRTMADTPTFERYVTTNIFTVPEYNPEIAYNANRWCFFNGKIYVSKADGTVGEPVAGPEWEEFNDVGDVIQALLFATSRWPAA